MTREETSALADRLLARVAEMWGSVYRDDKYEKVWQAADQILDGSYARTGRPGRPLLEGSNDTLPMVVPPAREDDVFASLHMHLSEDGQAARVQLLAVVPSADASFCIRFESPERLIHGDPDSPHGKHDFQHSQQSAEVKGGVLPTAISLPEWYPDSHLAIPLPAQDPIDLLLCALLSIREPNFLREAVHSTNKALGTKLAEFFARCGVELD